MFDNWDIKLHDIYRSLDHFELIKQDIQLIMHDQIKASIGREAKLVMYDVTNYYFEADYDDEDIIDEDGEVIEKTLRKRGPSKEKRPNPIVQLGLFVDTNNIPIAYKLFPGNQTDPITYIPAIKQVKKQFGLERIITVADKAMNSKNNISETLINGDGYLFSQKVRGSKGVPKDVQTFALERKDWKFNLNQTFGYKSTIRTRKLNDGKVVKEKIIVTWNQKYAHREQIRRNGAIEYAEKLTNSEKFRQAFKRGGKKYLIYEFLDEETGQTTSLSPFIHIDKKKLAEDAMYDGLNVLVTSELDRREEDLIANYKELYKIEESFRVTKTDLKTRPIYVRLDNHIESHFLTCFISLVILRMMQHKLKNQYSAAVIQEGLRSCQLFELGKGYHKISINETVQEIHKDLRIAKIHDVLKKEELNNYYKKSNV
jgi:transposase